MSRFFENILSNHQFDFPQGLSTHQCLLVLLVKWKSSVDRVKAFDGLLTDLSKAFDCLDHELLIAKLNPYGLSLPALRLIYTYLSNRKRKRKINCFYREWLEISCFVGFLAGSIFGTIFFNIYLTDFFLIMDDIDSKLCRCVFFLDCPKI